jgi:hypothetical protein
MTLWLSPAILTNIRHGLKTVVYNEGCFPDWGCEPGIFSFIFSRLTAVVNVIKKFTAVSTLLSV